jgi:hypothetical protein
MSSRESGVNIDDIMEVMKHKILMTDKEQKCWEHFLSATRQDEEKMVTNVDEYVKAVDNADIPYMQKWLVTAAWAKKHSHHYPAQKAER